MVCIIKDYYINLVDSTKIVTIDSEWKKITLKLKKSKMNSSIISSKTFKQVSSLVFIDGGVEDIQQLFDGVVAEAKAFVMDTVTDGVEQISEILQQYPGFVTVG